MQRRTEDFHHLPFQVTYATLSYIVSSLDCSPFQTFECFESSQCCAYLCVEWYMHERTPSEM